MRERHWSAVRFCDAANYFLQKMMNGLELPLRVACIAGGLYLGVMFAERFAPYSGRRSDDYFNFTGRFGAAVLGMWSVAAGFYLGNKFADGLEFTVQRLNE